ncbi:TPA: hypothetical protein EYM26_11365 [Candidatus Poribacteria bacterium]|nr:hypothetical protein [Candidatus Poribacteria bacterium]
MMDSSGDTWFISRSYSRCMSGSVINRVWFSLIKPPENFDLEGVFGIAKSVKWHEKLAAKWRQLKFTP